VQCKDAVFFGRKFSIEEVYKCKQNNFLYLLRDRSKTGETTPNAQYILVTLGSVHFPLRLRMGGADEQPDHKPL